MAQHRRLDQGHAVIAEIHVIAADEYRGGAKTAAADQLIGVVAQLVLVGLFVDGGEEEYDETELKRLAQLGRASDTI